MNQKMLYALWGGLFVLCAGLGFIPEPAGAAKGALMVLSWCCFLPPYVLLYRASRRGDRRTLALLRNLAAASLILTVAALIANFFSVLASETVGRLLYDVLVVVSSPMICGQYWAVSLFLWAFLMIASMRPVRRRK